MKTDFWMKAICFILIFSMILEHGAAACLCAAIIAVARLIDYCLDELANGWLIKQRIKVQQREGREGEREDREA